MSKERTLHLPGFHPGRRWRAPGYSIAGLARLEARHPEALARMHRRY